MKNAIKWDGSLNVGVEIIDTQHKILFDLANDLITAAHNGASMQVIHTLFSVIINFAYKHFDTEEAFFLEEKNHTNHCYQHYQLLKQLHTYSVEYRNNRKIEQDPGEFLKKWLLQHIKENDIPALLSKDQDVSLLPSIDIFEDFDKDATTSRQNDKRQQKRVRHDHILDEDITGHCFNATTMKSSPITVVDLAKGGLKIYSERHFDVDDLLVISCAIGKNFKMKEKVRVKNSTDNFYGVEFVSPNEGTVKFITELCGAVQMFR